MPQTPNFSPKISTNYPKVKKVVGVELTKLECDWPLSGLKKLSAILLNEKSLSFNQMLNLEFLSLNFADLGLLSRSGLGCLCKLKEIKVGYFIIAWVCDFFIYFF
jgi:hypothetical protein